MTYFKTFLALLFMGLFFFSSCKDKPKPPAEKATVPKPVFTEPAQNASGIWHYICSNRCAGGSGAAGNCATCGAALVHNGLYHADSNSTQAPAPTSGVPYAKPPTTAPATNAAGVYHYICSNGCAGGSGTAGNCSTCGNALAHNAAYH